MNTENSELLKQATKLCNDLDELMTMHHFFYQAAEGYFNSGQSVEQRGLSLFPGWMRERDVLALDAVHTFQEALRSTVLCERDEV